MSEISVTQRARASDLILVRLLAAGEGSLGQKKLFTDLSKAGGPALANGTGDEILNELRAAGHLASGRGLRLSDAGKTRALGVLGLKALPPKATWPLVRDRYLIGIATGTTIEMDLRTKGKLVPFVLKHHFALQVPEGATISAAMATLVCKQLGFPHLGDFKSLQAVILGKLLNPPQDLPADDSAEQFIRVLFNSKRGKVDELRQSVLASWFRSEVGGDLPRADEAVQSTTPPADSHDRQLDLQSFATSVQQAAEASPTGAFGDNKVFISHAWNHYRREATGPSLDLPAFKSQLVEANRAGLLILSRADLVAAMNPADVRDSETKYLNAEFHFILIGRGKS